MLFPLLVPISPGFFCWLKLRLFPPFPAVFACIQLDVALTLIPLYPYDFYTSGQLFYIPMCIQIGINLFATLVIFPSSLSTVYLDTYGNLLSPLSSAMGGMVSLLERAAEGDASLDEFMSFGPLIAEKRAAAQTGGTTALAMMESSLTRDVSYGRLSPGDLKELSKAGTSVVLRSGGLAFFFDIVRSCKPPLSLHLFRVCSWTFLISCVNLLLAPSPYHPRCSTLSIGHLLPPGVAALRHEHLDSKAFTVSRGDLDPSDDHSAFSTAPNSRAPSPEPSSHVDLPNEKGGASTVSAIRGDGAVGGMNGLDGNDDSKGGNSFGKKRAHFPLLRRGYTRSKSRGDAEIDSHHNSGSHLSLLDKLRKSQEPVGLFESQRCQSSIFLSCSNLPPESFSYAQSFCSASKFLHPFSCFRFPALADMNIEQVITHSDHRHIEKQFQILATSSLDLVHAISDSLDAAAAWTARINKDRAWSFPFGSKGGDRDGGPTAFDQTNAEVVRRLADEIERYRMEGRRKVVDPFKVRESPTWLRFSFAIQLIVLICSTLAGLTAYSASLRPFSRLFHRRRPFQSPSSRSVLVFPPSIPSSGVRTRPSSSRQAAAGPRAEAKGEKMVVAQVRAEGVVEESDGRL
jgi:hypothetical protein